MEKPTSKLKNQQLKSRQTVNKNVIIGSIIATFIATVPFLFNLHESVPNTKVWDTFLFTYTSGYYENANVAMWILTGKLIPLLLLLIWFLTCRHWWYHTLLVPIIMYVFQIISLFNDDQKFIDEFTFIYLLPIMAIVIPSIYLIRAQIFNNLNSVDKSMQDLEDEFKIKPKGLWSKVKQYF